MITFAKLIETRKYTLFGTLPRRKQKIEKQGLSDKVRQRLRGVRAESVTAVCALAIGVEKLPGRPNK